MVHSGYRDKSKDYNGQLLLAIIVTLTTENYRYRAVNCSLGNAVGLCMAFLSDSNEILLFCNVKTYGPENHTPSLV